MTFETIRLFIGAIIEENFYFVFLICGAIISFFAVKMKKLYIRRTFLILELNEARKKPNIFTRNIDLERIILNKIKNKDPFFDPDFFCSWTMDVFQKVCDNYTNNTLDSIKSLIEPNYFEQLSRILSNNVSMQIHHELYCKKISFSYMFSYTLEKNMQFIEVIIGAIVEEYKEDTLSHTIFYGDNQIQKRNTYKLKFGRLKGALSSKDNYKFSCPNCSGKIDSYTSICPYCKSLIIENGQVWSLYNIEKY